MGHGLGLGNRRKNTGKGKKKIQSSGVRSESVTFGMDNLTDKKDK